MRLVVGPEEPYHVPLVFGGKEVCRSWVLEVSPDVLVFVAVKEGNGVKTVSIISSSDSHVWHVVRVVHSPHRLQTIRMSSLARVAIKH